MSDPEVAPDDGVSPEEARRSAEAVAREIALRQLTIRSRSRHELGLALKRKNVPADICEIVLDRLSELGLVDDAVFAREWLSSGSRRHKGRTALRAELKTKGIAADVIEAAMAELDADRDYDVARAYASRKAASLHGLAPEVAYRRLAGALARRGFPPGVVAKVTRQTLSVEPDALAE